MRKYSIQEIDRLREACRDKILYGYYSGSIIGLSVSYRESEVNKHAEEMVRTFMLAGITPDELISSDQANREAAQRSQDGLNDFLLEVAKRQEAEAQGKVPLDVVEGGAE